MKYTKIMNQNKEKKVGLTPRCLVLIFYVISLMAMIYNDATTSLETGWLERVPFSVHNWYPASWLIPAFTIPFFLLPLYWRVGAKDYSWGICLFPVRHKDKMSRILSFLMTVLWSITALSMTLLVFDSIKDSSDNDIGFVLIMFTFLGVFWITINVLYYGIYWLKKYSKI